MDENEYDGASKMAQRAETENDGSPVELDEKDVADLKQQIEEIWADGAAGGTNSIFERRRFSEDTRYCYWEGQSPDGRQHSDVMKDRKPLYEGAPDHRVRLADMIINEDVAMLVVAALTAEIKVVGARADADEWAGKIQQLVNWIKTNLWGMDWPRTLARVANWQQADSPAIAAVAVVWEQKTCLYMEQIEAKQFAAAIAQLAVGSTDPNEVAQLEAVMLDPEREEEAAGLLRQLVGEKNITDKRARQVIRDLRQDGTAEFPQKYIEPGGPLPIPLRHLDDFLIPANTARLKNARLVAWRRWGTAAQIHQWAYDEEWSDEFRDEVLCHEGESLFPLWYTNLVTVAGDYSIQTARTYTKELHKGEFEVVTVFQHMVNEDGIPGIYISTIGAPKFAAYERRLCDYEDAEYPFVDFVREFLTNTLWNSRGLPETLMTDQSLMKKQIDLEAANAEMSKLPPIMVPFNRPKTPLILRPMGEIPQRRPGDYGWFPPPPQTIGVLEAINSAQARVDRYTARPNPENPGGMDQAQRQLAVNFFLGGVAEIFKKALKRCQQYMSDEQLQLITGSTGGPIFRSREEIQGEFHLRLSYDVKDADPAYIASMADAFNKTIVAMDRTGTIRADKAVAYWTRKFSPDLADTVLEPVNAAMQREVDDELKNFALIAAGVRPPMPEAAIGMNIQARLQVLQNITQQQPWAVEELSPTKKALLAERMKYLTFQMQQMQNATTGRLGVNQNAAAAGTLSNDAQE